jgi:hypothetical protein
MAGTFLTQAEAQALMVMEKQCVDDTVYVLQYKAIKLPIPLI